MNNQEIGSGPEIRLQVLRVLAVLLVQFVDVCFVGGFREPAFFVKQGKDTHGLLDQIDGRLEIKAKVDELPFYALFLVLFL